MTQNNHTIANTDRLRPALPSKTNVVSLDAGANEFPYAIRELNLPVKPIGDNPFGPLQPKVSKRQGRHHSLIRGAEARAIRFGPRDIYTGLVPLDQLGGKMMAGEALIEMHFWVLIGFVWTDIVEAFAQPFRLEIEVLGKRQHWTPDGLIRRRSGVDYLIECKPLERLQPDPLLEPEKATLASARRLGMRDAARLHGFSLLEMTEHEIRLEPRWYNANCMARGLSSNIPESIVENAVTVLGGFPRVALVSDLAAELPDDFNSILGLACVLDHRNRISLSRRSFFSLDSHFQNHCAVPTAAPDDQLSS